MLEFISDNWQLWNTASAMEKFQINADGAVAKITNNSATDELTGFIEYY